MAEARAGEAAVMRKGMGARRDDQLTAEAAAAEMVVVVEITTTVGETAPTRRNVGRRVVTATARTAPKSLQNLVRAAAQVAQARTKATRMDQRI